MGSDREQPPAHVVRSSTAGQVVQKLEEGFLQNILGVLMVPHQDCGEAIHG
jgi:hypothetical protein